MAMEYRESFSGKGPGFSNLRPQYPDELYKTIADLCDDTDSAWDAGCADGSSSVKLGDYFDEVTATDSDEELINSAPSHINVTYHVGQPEISTMDDKNADLVACANSLHRMNLETFHNEAKRVIKPGGVVAAWTYNLINVSEEVDDVIAHFYKRVIGSYWPKEHEHVHKKYKKIPFDFADVKRHEFVMTRKWGVLDLIGYLHSWEATQKYKEKNGTDPVEPIRKEILKSWNWVNEEREVSWPIYMITGR